MPAALKRALGGLVVRHRQRTGSTEDPFEVRFLQELRDRVPNVVIVDDAFAYSVRDNPLAGKQLLDAVLRSGRTGLEAKPSAA